MQWLGARLSQCAPGRRKRPGSKVPRHVRPGTTNLHHVLRPILAVLPPGIVFRGRGETKE